MILPQSEPLSRFQRYPLTWTLLALNVLIYFVFFAGQIDNFSQQKILKTESTIVTGKLYHQYLQAKSSFEQGRRAAWIFKLSPQSEEQMDILGSYALRDAEFLQDAQSMTFQGDEVAIAKWQKDLVSFRKHYAEDTIYNFGLNKSDLFSVTWLTYQFSHASLIHLFSNMLFLVVIGTAVEGLAGSFALLLLYLFGGVVGGAAFLYYNGHGVIPMVGASASISALLGFYVLAESRRRIRYVYFVSPFPGHNGFIYLPTLLIIPLFLLVDFTNMISNPDGVGSGVAYAAHAGGTVFGLILGAFARWGLGMERPLEYSEPILPREQNRDEEYSP